MEVGLESDEVEQGTVRLEIHKEVQAAVRPLLATGHGTEHGDGPAVFVWASGVSPPRLW